MKKQNRKNKDLVNEFNGRVIGPVFELLDASSNLGSIMAMDAVVSRVFYERDLAVARGITIGKVKLSKFREGCARSIGFNNYNEMVHARGIEGNEAGDKVNSIDTFGNKLHLHRQKKQGMDGDLVSYIANTIKGRLNFPSEESEQWFDYHEYEIMLSLKYWLNSTLLRSERENKFHWDGVGVDGVLGYLEMDTGSEEELAAMFDQFGVELEGGSFTGEDLSGLSCEDRMRRIASRIENEGDKGLKDRLDIAYNNTGTFFVDWHGEGNPGRWWLNDEEEGMDLEAVKDELRRIY